MTTVTQLMVPLLLFGGCIRAGFEVPGDVLGGSSDRSDSTEDSGAMDTDDGQRDAGLCTGFTGILCDDFESDLSKWTVDQFNGTVTRTPGAAHSGQGGVSVTLDGAGRSGLTADFAPVTGGSVYVSAWVRLAATPVLSSYLVLLELRDDPWSGQKISLDGEGEDRFQINATTAHTAIESSPGALPRGTWACLELFVNVADSGSAWVQVDGVRLEVNGDTLPVSGMFNRMMIGLSTSGQAMSADFDDVRIGDQVYGCSGQTD